MRILVPLCTYCLMSVSQSVVRRLFSEDVIGRLRVIMMRGCRAMIMGMLVLVSTAAQSLFLDFGPDILCLLVIRDLFQLSLVFLNLLLEQHLVRLNLV